MSPLPGKITHLSVIPRTHPLFDLSTLHTFGLKARAANLISITHKQDVSALSQLIGPYLLLGEGSNSIFVEDYPGTVVLIRLSGIHITETEDDYWVDVAAGENWHQLVSQLLENNMPGLENLALIPGTVGAASVQNIGAYGKELSDLCDSVECIDMNTMQEVRFSNKECAFGYRDSIFKRKEYRHYLITSVKLRISKQWQPENNYAELKKLPAPVSAKQIFDKVIAIRTAKLPDPEQHGNAGSFFKNPIVSVTHFEGLKKRWKDIPGFVDGDRVKVPAAWLLDQCQVKGSSYQGIASYQNQPLVLINQNQGTGEALLQFARDIIARVEETFSIRLHNEVRLIGENGLIEL